MSDAPPMEVWQQPPVLVRGAPYRAAGGQPGTRLPTAALVLGVVAVLCNVLFVPTVLAIVFGAVSLGKGTAARGRAIAGIALGAIGVVAVGVQVAIAIPVFIALQHAALASTIESTIERSAESQGVTLTGVHCTVPPSTQAGSTTDCTATGQNGARMHLRITFTDAHGDFTVQEAQR